eukprot:1573443-Rhodomonas_salina.3
MFASMLGAATDRCWSFTANGPYFLPSPLSLRLLSLLPGVHIALEPHQRQQYAQTCSDDGRVGCSYVFAASELGIRHEIWALQSVPKVPLPLRFYLPFDASRCWPERMTVMCDVALFGTVLEVYGMFDATLRGTDTRRMAVLYDGTLRDTVLDALN